jgi:hypothetical protein
MRRNALRLLRPTGCISINQPDQGGQFYVAELGTKGVSFMLPLTEKGLAKKL